MTEHLAACPDASPWHVCFAVGLIWGHLARLELDFTTAAVRLLSEWNDDDLKIVRQFHYERGPDPIEQSLMGGYSLFEHVVLPPLLPKTLKEYARAQERWLGRIISPDRPRFIGSWNATAMFMMAVASDAALAAQLTTPSVMLPPSGPIFTGLSILHRVHVLTCAPSGTELDDEAFEPGAIYENNALFEDILHGLPGWSLLDVNCGLYMLGTRHPDSDNWY